MCFNTASSLLGTGIDIQPNAGMPPILLSLWEWYLGLPASAACTAPLTLSGHWVFYYCCPELPSDGLRFARLENTSPAWLLSKPIINSFKRACTNMCGIRHIQERCWRISD